MRERGTWAEGAARASRRAFLAYAAFAVAAALPLRRGWAAPAPRPVRVATLLPYVAEALAGAGEGVEVVAAVGRRLGEPPVAGAADLGSPHAPDLERLAAARPDLVVADRRLQAALAGDLGRTGARVVLVEADSVAGTFEALATAARESGVGEVLAPALAAAEAQLDAARLPRPVAVLPVFGAPGSLLAITGRTWLGDLLDRLGFVNLADRVAGAEPFAGYVALSGEVLATLRPERVLLLSHGDPEAVAAAFRRMAEAGGPWAGHDAPLTVLDPGLFASNPGLRLPEAARWLAAEGGR